MSLAYSTHRPELRAQRATDLVIVRQSSTQAYEDLAALLERTLYLYPDLCGWDEIYGRGIDPLRLPGPEDAIEALPGRGRACLYQVDGTWVLLILGSAAAPDERGFEHDGHENAVVNLICKWVRELRPTHVRVGPFDRLCRSQHFASKTYGAFEKAGVQTIHYEGAEGVKELQVGSGDGDTEFFALASVSHANLKTVVTRTTRGKVSLARRNKFFLGVQSAPFGFTLDDQKHLVPEPEDRASLKVMVRGFANDDTDAEIARRLLAEAPVRRRRGHEGSALRNGERVPTQGYAPMARHARVVYNFRLQMLDLAMGKYVMPQLEPASTRASHVGVRREAQGDDRFTYFFAWSVPDLFEGFGEALLDAALLNVARRTHRSGKRPASLWLYECERRREAVQQFQKDPSSIPGRNAREWLNGDVELKRAVGSGPEHPRAARVRDIVARVVSEPATGNPKTSTPKRTRLFAGYPAWRQGEEEWRIATTPETYTLLRRPAHSGLAEEKSLSRAWGIAGGLPRDLIAAQIPHEVFTDGLARAAAAAIEDGVEILRGQHAASVGILDAIANVQTARILRRQALLRALEDARADVDFQQDRQRFLARRRYREGTEERFTPTAPPDGIAEAQIDDAVDREFQAHARARDLEREIAELDRADGEQRVPLLPDLDDLELTLQTLVAMRTRVGGDNYDVEAVRNLFHNLRIVAIDTFTATLEFRLRLPAPDDTWLGTEPIRVDLALGGTNPVGYDNWSHAYTEELCMRQLAVDHCRSSRVGHALADPNFTPGDRAWEGAIRYLMRHHGLERSPAKHILGTVNLLPRTIAYLLMTGGEIDHAALGVSPDYVEQVHRTFLSTDPNLPVKRPDHKARRDFQRLLNAIIASDKPYWRGEDLADFRRLPRLEDPKAREHTAAIWAMLRRENIDALLTKIEVPGMARHGKIMALPAYTARPCPHCDAAGDPHPLDIVAWNPEVPGGLLCSKCLRTGRADSIVYPDAYRALLEAGEADALSGAAMDGVAAASSGAETSAA